MKKSIVILLFLLLLSGCMQLTKINPVPPDKEQVFTNYIYGKTLEKSVGDQLIEYNIQLTVETYPGFTAIESFQPPNWGLATFSTIYKGSDWKVIGKLETGESLCKSVTDNFTGGGAGSYYEACLIVRSNEPVGVAACAPYNEAPYFEKTMPLLWEKKPQNFLIPKKIIEKHKKSWRDASILYVGKGKDVIRLLYRETALKDIEFTFDLSESKTVAIKDITFEILEATNSSIKYKILTTPDELRSKIEQREKAEKEKREY